MKTTKNFLEMSKNEVESLNNIEKNKWALEKTADYYSKKNEDVEYDRDTKSLVINNNKIIVYANISDSDLIQFKKHDLNNSDIVIIVKYGRNEIGYSSLIISPDDVLKNTDGHKTRPAFKVKDCKHNFKLLKTR